MRSIDISTAKFDGSPNYEIIILGEKIKAEKRRFNVLDLGCGDGRNSFYLSGCNCLVDAIDIDEGNLNCLQYLAALYGREINTICQDVTKFQFEKKYDIILAHGLLHFLNVYDTENLLNNIVKNTKEGGINIFTTAYYGEGDNVPISFLKAGHKNEYTVDGIKKYYERWNIVLSEDYYKWDYHHSLGAHGHRIQKLIVQKPDSAIILDTFELEVSEIVHCNNSALMKFLNTHKNEIVSKYNIQKSFKYLLDGPQFGFGAFAENGLLLEFDVIQNLLVQSNNNIVSGITELQNNFTMLK